MTRALVFTFAVACAPGPVGTVQGANMWCSFDQAPTSEAEAPVKAAVTTSFPFEGGTCHVQCEGVPDLTCELRPQPLTE